MTKIEIINSIKLFCEKLSNPLAPEDCAAGWTDARRVDVLQYFQKLERDLVGGNSIPYISLARTLDSVGITEGRLLEEAYRITNEINARRH